MAEPKFCRACKQTHDPLRSCPKVAPSVVQGRTSQSSGSEGGEAVQIVRPADVLKQAERPSFDRTAYQRSYMREYMRKYRAKGKGQ